MTNIKEIHEKVFQFLLDWRETQEKDLVFTLRRRPKERLQAGYWFLGNDYYLAFSFWTGTDVFNRTQNIYLEIHESGQFSLKFSAKDDSDKAQVLRETAEALGGGLTKAGKTDIWTKTYEGLDYLKNLELFLTEDRKRIDTLLSIQKRAGYNNVFDKALNKLNDNDFEEQLSIIQQYRQASVQEATPLSKQVKSLILRDLTVVNVGHFGSCKIQFGQRATCLIGPNGGGKTTLLRALALGLVGTGSPLIDTKTSLQNLPRITGADENCLLKYAGDGTIQVSYQFDGKIFENGKSNIIPFKPKQETGIVEFGGDQIEVDGFGLPLDEGGMDGDGELPILVIGYPQRYGRKPDGTDIKKRSPKPNAFDVIPLIHDTEDNRIESLKIWISETWNQGDKHKNTVRDLFRVISAVLTPETGEDFTVELKSAISPRKIVVKTPTNPEGIPFDLLSTGLSNLFGWIGHLISRMHEAYNNSENPIFESAVVLVDEIDNYLHPLVQARTIPVLIEFFPKVQFVFTSHAPVVLATLQKEQVKAYRIEDGKAIEISYFYGRTVQDILLDEYGINKRPSSKMQVRIEEMFRFISMGQQSQAKLIFDELLPILGEDDAAIQDAKHDLT
ncbi:MAG: hypothetical protein RIR11_1652 [Bacteroidota bacterium]